jgi:hypothetical protein
MLSPPPIDGGQYPSSKALLEACQRFGLSEGYVVNCRSTEESRGVIRLKCDRRTRASSRSTGKQVRQRASNNCDCPFGIVGRRNRAGQWRITKIIAEHNHPGAEHLLGLATAVERPIDVEEDSKEIGESVERKSSGSTATVIRQSSYVSHKQTENPEHTSSSPSLARVSATDREPADALFSQLRRAYDSSAPHTQVCFSLHPLQQQWIRGLTAFLGCARLEYLRHNQEPIKVRGENPEPDFCQGESKQDYRLYEPQFNRQYF